MVERKGLNPFSHFPGDTMDKKAISILLFSILLTSGIASAQDQFPLTPPPGYFGSVTVNGQLAPAGTTIIAKIGEEVRGSLPTASPGLFGDDPGPSKLWVTGYPGELTPEPVSLTFYINDVAANQTIVLTGAGTINKVDLTFIMPTTSDSGGASGGSGSVGTGVISAEPSENIEFYETKEANLVAGIPVTFRFNNPQLSVYELVITANVSTGVISAKVEHLKGTSRIPTSPPPGTIYENVNVWLGTSGFSVPGNLREGIIKFRVNNTWLSGENIDANKVSIMHWDGNQWISLETKQTTMDSDFAYYEAFTDSFSPFAISGVKEVPTETPGITQTSVQGETPESLAVMPPIALNWVLYVVVAISVIAASYYYYTLKRNKKK
ncbi:MAG: PGF-pre-PGF domain-containing protein [Candidatus Methanoperedenaceae archaeon]|nr:PGF-pre-PGF domain-containing protein [Candidatus Methanoperedenaceae archaeon]